MKIKKLFATSVAIIGFALVGLVGCARDADSTEESKYVFTDEKPTVYGIRNGAVDIDPLMVSQIEITFPSAMNTRYSDFIRNSDISDDILGSGWANEYTYIIRLNLTYDQSYEFVFNDDTYTGNDYNIENSYLRTADGKFIKRFPINFSTRKSPNANSGVKTYTLDLGLTTEWPIAFANNTYEQDGETKRNQQALISLKSCLNHEKVKKGDIVRIPYKIRSTKNIKNIRATLVDTSWSADYWTQLSSSDVVIVDDDGLEGSTTENPIYKEGVLQFEITEDMVGKFVLQIFTLYKDNPDLVTLIYVPTSSNVD